MGFAERLRNVAVRATQWRGPTDGADPGALSEIELERLNGQPLDHRELEGKVLLIVNVASKCAFTPQYDGLQALWEAHKDEGLVIIGVPCNQFGWQEPGGAAKIQAFCQLSFGVGFPLLAKQDVNGRHRSPLYRWLVGSRVGGGQLLLWNFEKFLVGRDGEVVARWPSEVTPDAPELVAAITEALAG